MEPNTAAIVAVLQSAANETVKSAVKDAYDGLKAVILRKCGVTGPITKAISALEQDPKSKAQAAVLEEKIVAGKAADDAEVVEALDRLVGQMKAHGGDAVASAQFNVTGGIQGAVGQNVHVDSMTIRTPRKG